MMYTPSPATLSSLEKAITGTSARRATGAPRARPRPATARGSAGCPRRWRCCRRRRTLRPRCRRSVSRIDRSPLSSKASLAALAIDVPDPAILAGQRHDQRDLVALAVGLDRSGRPAPGRPGASARASGTPPAPAPSSASNQEKRAALAADLRDKCHDCVLPMNRCPLPRPLYRRHADRQSFRSDARAPPRRCAARA